MDNFNLLGYDLFGDDINVQTTSPLKRKFFMPPFTVLDAKTGEWQQRKKAWLSYGLKGELGRGEELTGYNSMTGFMSKKGDGAKRKTNGTSVFDPVLTELVYRWFCPHNGMILDPFAGGSVRGVVAAMMGHEYIGVELRPEQVSENIRQGDELCNNHKPLWIQGDSNHIQRLTGSIEADLVFSCPPYFDLEKYSNDEADLSNLTYSDFVDSYRNIIIETCSLLRDNRFACFVVGNVRDKKGNYLDLVSETIKNFECCGLKFYNDAVLLTNDLGTAAMRANKQFSAGRKLVKIHQNILVFVKGDGKLAAKSIIDALA
jgi:16S rRNA G966 N2-methylase RsmD